MKNNKKLLLTLVLGVSAGAIMGILMAPHKGSKTRRLIREEGKKVADQICETLEEGRENMQSMRQEVKNLMKGLACKEDQPEEKRMHQNV